MKFHYLLAVAVANALTEIFQKGRYADQVVEKTLRSNPKWGVRDRAFIAENVYDAVRRWRLLWFLAGEAPSFEREKLIRLLGLQLALNGSELPDRPEFAGLETADILAQRAGSAERKIRESIPDWLDERGAAELGEDKWNKELAALNLPAPVVARVNTLKTDRATLQTLLAKEGWETVPTALAPDALVFNRRGAIFKTAAYQGGLFEVQDAGSQLIAPFLSVAPGMRVVDACAGAGGKTLHLAALMQNKGKIIALDTEAWKLEELKKRAARNGVSIIETRVIESPKTIQQLQGFADRLLLDAPCSGLGVLRRNPDAKWKLKPEAVEDVIKLQEQILRDYSTMLQAGGEMVYATCSVLPSENERQAVTFLSAHPTFQLEAQRTLTPAVDGCDGFYMAKLLEKR